MNQRLTPENFMAMYDQWYMDHEGAIPPVQLLDYVENGDQFGRRMSTRLLAKLCRTSATTFNHWRPIIKEVIKQERELK